MSLDWLLPDLPIESPKSRKDVVLQLLRRGIAEGLLSPGERIDADEIAARLGCSRMPVRDALKELEAEGLVECFHSRSTRVSALAPDDIEQIFAIRLALERLALSRAVANVTADELATLTALLDDMDDAPDLKRWLELNERFHAVINAASRWPRLVAEIEKLRRNIGRYLRARAHKDGLPALQQQHRDLLAALRSRDAPRALAVLDEHLMRTARVLMSEGSLRAPANENSDRNRN